MSDWQPIETAPKDGTAVLVGWTSGMVRSAYYDIHHTSGTWAWFTQSGMYAGSVAPTHWMPLPAPPQEPTDAD